MEKSTDNKLLKIAVFMSVGYICAGSIITILAGIPIWAEYVGTTVWVASIGLFVTFILSIICSILLIRYLIPKYGAKAIYEQDILVYMIGLLFMSLTMNPAMFIFGIFISLGALCVFFYENFNRQVSILKTHSSYFMILSGWAVGPIVAAVALLVFNQYGMTTARIIFAHYIVIAFWVWIQRLAIHENYNDAASIIFGKKANDLEQNDINKKI